MVVFTCPRCCYSTEQKANIEKHINRKKLCNLQNLDVDPKDYKKDILREFTSDDLIMMKLANKILQEKVEILTINGNHNTVDNSTNINNNIKIVINNYNEPNLDYITDKHYRKYIKDVNSAYLKMCKEIYFNPQHPENKSIHKTNKKDNFISYYQDGKWRIGDKKTVLPEILECIYEAFDKEATDEQLTDLESKLNKNKISKDIVAECYNNKP